MEKIKLGDISKLINGDRGKNYPSQADITKEGEIPFVNAGHLNGRNIDFGEMNYISREKYGKLSSGKFQRGDILYCLRGSLGKKAIVSNDIEGAIASSLVVIRPDREKVNGEYLMLALDSPAIKEQLVKANNGSSQPNLSAASVREYDIELPELSVQKEVVERLEKVKNVIDSRMQELQLLDELIKARFVEMFGDPISNPMEWPVKRLAEISLLITNGNTPKGGSENYVDKGIMFLRSQNVWRNRIDLGDVAYIDETTHFAMEKSSVHNKDILITKTGRINTENSSLGRAALFHGKDNSANINGHVYLVRLDGTMIPEYVVAILTGEPYRRYIRKVCVGGIDKRQINLDQVEDFPIILPPLELQKQFANFVAQIDKLKVAVQKALDETQLLFDSLMQKYFG